MENLNIVKELVINQIQKVEDPSVLDFICKLLYLEHE